MLPDDLKRTASLASEAKLTATSSGVIAQPTNAPGHVTCPTCAGSVQATDLALKPGVGAWCST